MIIQCFQKVPGMPEPPFEVEVERETNMHFFFVDEKGETKKANKGACLVMKGEAYEEESSDE